MHTTFLEGRPVRDGARLAGDRRTVRAIRRLLGLSEEGHSLEGQKPFQARCEQHRESRLGAADSVTPGCGAALEISAVRQSAGGGEITLRVRPL